MSTTEQMKAAYITRLGGPEVIEYGRLPVPVPGPTDFLVQVEASTVNPVDVFVRTGAYATATPFPFVLGRDLVGTVVAAGTGATAFRPGQQVWCNSLGHAGRQGAWAQYAVVAAERLYPLPDGVDPIDVALAAHPAASAWLGLFRHALLQAGETVYVGGGGGNVGSAAVALAALVGARVIATAAESDHDLVLSLGADLVVDHHEPDLPELLAQSAPDGFDVFLDTSGHYPLAAAIDLLAPGARLIAMVGLHGSTALPIRDLYTRDASIVGFAISNAAAHDLSAAAKGVALLLQQTQWRPRRAGEARITDAREVHRRMAAGQIRGRLLVRP